MLFRFIVLTILFASTFFLQSATAQTQQLTLDKGDHICIIGNTLADRMQHDGWLEAHIQVRFPNYSLVIRNLGFSADTLNIRLRSKDFGSPDQHLTENGADVIFMMFGYNESYSGREGLEQFKRDLAKQIQHLQSKKYNGVSAPRIVVFSPNAFENHRSRNLPDGIETNDRLSMYTEAMKDVADDLGVRFVDLFGPTMATYETHESSLTLNGIHLNSQGNKVVAEIACLSLFGHTDAPAGILEATRKAVIEKNFYWYNHYRTPDGYSMFGGRADLKFTDGQTNRVVMERELDVIQIMTDNRDPAIWAAALGQPYTIDDSKTPDFVPVISNKPGEGPDGGNVFVSGEESAERMKLLEGFQVNLFASEEQFPELVNPVQMAFDTKGRLFVAAWQSYPHWKPKDEMNDKLLILEDTDGDGRADRCKTFADGLRNPTGFEFWGGGVFVAAAPEILFLEDTDGDDVVDKRTIVLHGLDTADTHHTANSFTLGPGGGLYFQEGTFHHTQVETPYGPPVRSANGAVYRYEPRTQKFMVYTPKTYANPHGHVFDRWGQDIIHDGTGAVPYHGTLISSHLEFPDKHGSAPAVYERRTRPLPATEILSSRHFPDEMQDELLVQNVIGDLGILRYRISDNGSSLQGEELEPLLLSDDQNFRPVDLEFGPRGELFFTDWANPIIGHMQHNIRDPNRDQSHGRVFRITHKTRPLGQAEKIAGVETARLISNLTASDNRIRYRTRIELSGRDSDEVIRLTQNWVSGMSPGAPNRDRHMLEALWVHQHHNSVNQGLLEQLLRSNDFRIRAAATRVLCYWRDMIPDSASRMLRMASDESPRVRLEALRSASFFQQRDGLPILVQVLNQPMDKYLNWLAKEVIRAFPSWQNELVTSELIAIASPPAVDFFLGKMTSSNVQRLPRSKPVCQHLIFREGIGETTRGESMARLAQLNGVNAIDQLIASVTQINPESTKTSVINELVRLLSMRSSDELKTVRPQLAEMATGAKLPILRRIGYIGMLTADQNIEPVWSAATKSPNTLLDLISALPLLPDPNIQTLLFPKVLPLLNEAPTGTIPSKDEPISGRFVRIELPGKRKTLTLAEVQIFSGEENIARNGVATQSATAHKGKAGLAIDGTTSPSFQDHSQTHTPENRPNPWWEVDLGTERQIERIKIFNRIEGQLGKRLDDFTLKILDNRRQTVFIKKNQPAPDSSVKFEIGATPPAVRIRRAAIEGISFVRGKEKVSFEALSEFVVNDVEVAAAIRSIQRIPIRFWTAENAPRLAELVIKKLRSTPAAERNTATAADAMQFVESLTNLLPAEDAERVRTELAELGVRVIRIGTRPHRMSYDKELLVVQTGKTIDIIFENTDMMPHNLVVVTPGSMETIGMQAEREATQKDAIKNHYVPKSDLILLSSKLIQPGQQQRLTFDVPKTPGVYPYVCTYPGHWRRMFGILMVVNEPGQYTANQDKYMSDNQLEIQDELLKLVLRTKTEWQLADFENSFVGNESEFLSSRNFNSGKQMFQISSCISCHKVNGEGYEIGPDLTKELDPKWTEHDILREILEPSKKIDEKYRTQIFALETGDTISGIVTFQDENLVKVVENPLVANDPKTIEKFEIEDQRVSDVSIMPKGLLDTLTRNEILDLIAYIVAKGDPKHHLYKNGDHAGH